MPKKAFDLMPPYPKPSNYHHHMSKSKREKVKSQKTFMLFLFGLFFIFIVFTLMKIGNYGSTSSNTDTTTKKTETTTSTDSNTNNSSSSNQFELFNDQGNSAFTNNTNITSVRLYNGASSEDNLNTAKDLFLKAGYKIEKTDKAANEYDKTIIYYRKNQLSLAQKAADTLKPKFETQLQESANLDSSYDLLVIIGNK